MNALIMPAKEEMTTGGSGRLPDHLRTAGENRRGTDECGDIDAVEIENDTACGDR